MGGGAIADAEAACAIRGGADPEAVAGTAAIAGAGAEALASAGAGAIAETGAAPFGCGTMKCRAQTGQAISRPA